MKQYQQDRGGYRKHPIVNRTTGKSQPWYMIFIHRGAHVNVVTGKPDGYGEKDAS